jgi:hypothetical protein
MIKKIFNTKNEKQIVLIEQATKILTSTYFKVFQNFRKLNLSVSTYCRTTMLILQAVLYIYFNLLTFFIEAGW